LCVARVVGAELRAIADGERMFALLWVRPSACSPSPSLPAPSAKAWALPCDHAGDGVLGGASTDARLYLSTGRHRTKEERMRSRAMLVAVAIAVGCLAGFVMKDQLVPDASAQVAAQPVEYSCEYLGGAAIWNNARLNEMAEDGWRLIGVHNHWQYEDIACFERVNPGN